MTKRLRCSIHLDGWTARIPTLGRYKALGMASIWSQSRGSSRWTRLVCVGKVSLVLGTGGQYRPPSCGTVH